jgi:DNA polymerase-3 subunit alpha
MGIIRLEDLKGKVEAILFPDDLEKYRPLVTPDAVVFLRGRVDRRREEPSLRVTEVIPAAEAAQRLAEYVILAIGGNGTDPALLQTIKVLCAAHPGRCPVYLEVCTADQWVATINCAMSVECTQGFVEEAAALLGAHRVTLRSRTRRAIPRNGTPAPCTPASASNQEIDEFEDAAV